MKILFIGVVPLALEVAASLSSHEVSFLDSTSYDIPYPLVVGDPLDPKNLHYCKVNQYDHIFIMYSKDEMNLVLASLLKFEYNVTSINVLLNSHQHLWLYTPIMGVDHIIDSLQIIKNTVLKELLNE